MQRAVQRRSRRGTPPEHETWRHLPWLSAALLTVVFVVIRWNSFLAPLERDEGEYAYSAWLMTHGGTPYEQAFMQKPPLIIYTYMVAQWMAPRAIWLPRLFSLLFLGAAVVVLAAIARREVGRKSGLTAAWLATGMLAFSALAPFAANTECFLVLPMLAAIWLYDRHRGNSALWEWGLAGACSAAALLFKPIAIYCFAFIGVVWFVETWRTRRSVVRAVIGAGTFVIGGALTTVIVLAPFLLRDGGATLWEVVVRFNSYYLGFEQGSIVAMWLGILWRGWWLVLLLPLWLCFQRWPRWWMHVGLTLGSLGGVYQAGNGHYYLIVVPFLALLATAALRSLSTWLAARGGGWRSRWVELALTAAALVVVFLPVADTVRLTPEDLVSFVYGIQNPFVEARTVAQHVATLTTPDDFVYVAGSEPEILWYAERRSPTRFVIAYPMMLTTPVAATYQRQAIEDLRQRPPAVIVFAAAQYSWLKQPGTPNIFYPFLENLINERYRPVGGWLPDRAGGTWVEPISARDAAEASLIVYRRRS